MAAEAWSSVAVPPETVQAVRAAVDQLVDGIVVAVRSENPVYAHVLGGPEGIGIRLGIEQAMKSFLDAIERGERPTGETGEVWRRLGEAEFQAGRSLEAPGRAATGPAGAQGCGRGAGADRRAGRAHRSLRWARLTLELLQRGALPAGDGLTRVGDHLAELILLRDPELAAALMRRCLWPLDSIASADRERLLETLAAWLAHQRHTPAVAAELHVHPQTVRYRIGKLRELLGDALDTADGRFELELALRARRGLGPA
jgi:hypothetical protein